MVTHLIKWNRHERLFSGADIHLGVASWNGLANSGCQSRMGRITLMDPDSSHIPNSSGRLRLHRSPDLNDRDGLAHDTLTSACCRPAHRTIITAERDH